MNGLRILLVDDNPINQKVALRILEKDGHRVSPADNGLEALRAVREREYDIVLMDVQMPEMDGLEATRRIRAGESGEHYRRLPIIAVTAHAMPQDREACLAAGMDDYVSKPIQSDVLREAIARLAPGSPAPERTPAAAGPGGGEGPPVFDREGMLDRLDGDEELCVEVIEVFLSDTPARMESLREAARAGDGETVEYMAHSIKGAAGNIGADRTAALAYRIEKAGADGDVADAAGMVDALEKELRLLDDTLREAGLYPLTANKTT